MHYQKTAGYNNKILVSNRDMEIGCNKDINKVHKNPIRKMILL